MFNASRNLQLKIITGLIFVGLVGCNDSQDNDKEDND